MKQALLAIGVAALIGGSAIAQDLVQNARLTGQVGERYDGFLGIVGPPTEALRRQVAAINIKRRSLYAGLATRKGVSPEEVGLTAACTTLSRVAPGEYYFVAEQGWKRRGPADAAPVPAYCAR